MKYIKLFLLTFGFMSLFSITFAGEISTSEFQQRGYFIGMGGAFNFGRLDSHALGTLNVTSGFPPLGVFSGGTSLYNTREQAFSPEVQVGYLGQFQDSKWLWGLEFLYQYSHLKLKVNGLSIDAIDSPFTTLDTLKIGGIETQVKDTLMLPFFIGNAYRNGFIYFGVGPSLFNTQQNISNINDSFSALYIGNIDGISRNKWKWGTAVQIGLAYYLDSTWFLKLNYTYAFPADYTQDNSASFSPTVNQGLNSGTLDFHSQQSLVIQEVAVSINKVFGVRP